VQPHRYRETSKRWPTGDDPEVVVAFPPKRDSDAVRHSTANYRLPGPALCGLTLVYHWLHVAFGLHRKMDDFLSVF
jgi:hypothetical protein